MGSLLVPGAVGLTLLGGDALWRAEHRARARQRQPEGADCRGPGGAEEADPPGVFQVRAGRDSSRARAACVGRRCDITVDE